MRKIAPVFSLFLLAVLMLTSVPLVEACGPSFTIPVFAFESRPDKNFADYARGDLGLVQPEYHPSLLFAAYRYFNNSPFSANEQKELVKVWHAEFYREDDKETDTNQAVRDWIAARKKVVPDEPEPTIYTARSWDNSYEFFPNCTTNAFETATKTLENRISSHGANNENVKNWTRAQDTVFQNCAEGKQYPAEVDENAPAWLKNDRQYQIAAAHFYTTSYDEAKARFAKIAQNRDSAWSATANYLVARTLIRQASLIEDNDEAARNAKRRPLYEQAETHLQKILADASQREFHPAAAKLVNLIKYRLHPEERIHELGTILMQSSPNENLRQDLTDYRWLMDRYAGAALSSAEKAGYEKAQREGSNYDYNTKVNLADFPANVREDDLSDWIFTFSSAGDDTFPHALAKWRETRSAAWFAAAISKAKKENAEIAQLLTEAERVERSAPAFATIVFHQVRLLVETGKQAEARRKLNSILNDKSLRLPVSAQNQFASQRMLLAENLDEFLQFAQRRATAFASDGSPYYLTEFSPEELKNNEYAKNIAGWRNRTMFDEDSVRVFNEQMPLSLLKQAAGSAKLPDYLKRNVLIAAWTKALLLNDDAAAQELAPQLVAIAPEFQTLFAHYINAKTPIARHNSAAYILLKTPALRPVIESGYGRIDRITEIDNYRDNWWCAPKDNNVATSGEEKPIASTPSPSFLTVAQLAVARREREKLKSLGNSATYLARRAVEFAQTAPTDSRVPESLHLAVRATRYGCQDCDTGKFSKQAHDLLKKRFPGSEWTRKTPYWFKDESCSTK